jgi:bifunctional non-homologous end joining protein LigD
MIETTKDSKLRRAHLFFREGGSDKVYHVWMEETAGGLYLVAASWGRRGATLQQGVKCKPTSNEEATNVFVKTVNEKISKGYKRSEDDPSNLVKAALDSGRMVIIPVCAPPKAQATTPKYLPQLLNPIAEGEAEHLIRRAEADHWGAQEKYDGHHKIIVTDAVGGYTLNKKGELCGISAAVQEYAMGLKVNCVLDGESIGDKFYAFDLLKLNGVDLRGRPYGTRYKTLLDLLPPNGWPIERAPLVTGEKAIRKFYAMLKERNAEGIVFKDLLARHAPGRPNSGGPQLKCKWYSTCSAVVIAHNAQRSVALALYLDDKLHDATDNAQAIGNVTIPANHEVPKVGAVVEVRYLYFFRGGSLYQPTYLGERDDVAASECTVEKQNLKVKAEAGEKVEG